MEQNANMQQDDRAGEWQNSMNDSSVQNMYQQPQPYQQPQIWIPKQDSERLTAMVNDFAFFGVGSLIYGFLFATCLYRGAFGIGTAMITLVTMIYTALIMKKWGKPFRKRDLFYAISMLALSVSTFLTGDVAIQFFNLCGVLLLAVAYLLNHFADTRQWGFTKYATEFFNSIFTPLSYVGYPLKSVKAAFTKKDGKKDGKGKYVCLGLLVSIPLLVIILAIMASADAVFANVLGSIFKDFTLPEYPIYWIFLFVFGTFGSFCLFAFFADDKIKTECAESKKYEPIVAITFLSVITLVYLVFSMIQILYLFIGNFTLPDGYTYAEYAREGFFQLLILCVINLVIIICCITGFYRHKVLNVVMTILSLCTYIMIASSAMRMTLYVQAYDLSYLRVMTYWGLVVIGLLLLGTMIQIYSTKFPLFNYGMVVVTVCYICLAYARPDYVVAEYDVGKQDIDYNYLVDLGPDGVPALVECGYYEDEFKEDGDIKRDEYSTYFRSYAVENATEIVENYNAMGVMDFNLSKYRAGNLLIHEAEKYGVELEY